MPRAKTKNAPGLEILLHRPQDPPNSTALSSPTPANYNPTYRPGNTITGTVSLTSTSDVPIGTVDIKFYARAKVKIVQNHGESTSEYRSRANFFTLEQTLFEGGYTFKPGKWDWPFAFACPTRADAQRLRGGTDKKGRAKVRFKPRGEEFLNTEGPEKEAGRDEAQYKEYVSEHALPATMNYYHGMFGRQAWGYVEYVLVATLTEPESGSGSGGGMFKTSPKKRVSTRALTFVAEQKQDVIKDWGLTTETHRPTIRSSKLITAAGSSSGSTSKSPIESETNSFFTSFSKTTSNTSTSTPEVQGLDSPSSENPIMASPRRSSSFFSRLSLTRTSPLSPSIFSRSSTPRLALTVTVTYPTIIQVAHPTSVPFSINIAPDTSPGATTLNPDQYPSVLIKSFTFILVCCTKTRVTQWKKDEKDGKTVNIKVCENMVVDRVVELREGRGLAMLDREVDEVSDYTSMFRSAGGFDGQGKGELEKLERHTSLERRGSQNSPTATASTLSPSTTANSSLSKRHSATTSSDQKAGNPKSCKSKSPHLPSNDTPSPSTSSNPFNPNSNSTSVDLGPLASLSLRSAKLGHIIEPLLIPTFSTYNIMRSFGLKYSIDLEVLGTGTVGRGEKVKIKGEAPKGGITVIGVADSVREQLARTEGAADGGPMGMGGLPGYDALEDSDLDELAGRVDDDDAENEEMVENMAHSKAREARDEKNELRRREGRDGLETGMEEEEALPRYSK